MKLKTHLLLSMALACLNLFGATYYWNGGTITSLSSWPNAKGGSTFASNFTTSGDIWDLNLATSSNVDISGWSTNGKLTNSAASTIIATLTTTSGDFTSSYVGAVWVVPTTNLVVSGINVIYSAAGATIPGLTYANLRFSNSTGTSTAAAAITVSGTLTTTSGGTLAMEANTLTFSGTGTTLTNGGTITSRVATPFADSRTTKTFGGTVTYLSLVGGQAIASGTYTTLNINCTVFTNTAAGEISVSGTLTTASGGTLVMGSNTLTFSASGTTLSNSGTISTAATTAFTDSRTTKTFGGTITYSALAGGQTIATGNYATLTLSNTSGTNTANGAIAVTNALIIPSSTTLNMSTYALTCSGTIANYGTLKTSATNNPPFTTTTTSMGGKVEFASANGGQFIPDKTYALLTLSNTSGTNTARGAIISSGALTIGASTILDMSSYVLTCNSTLTNNGTLKTITTTNPAFTTTTTSIGGTVELASANGGQFVPAKTYATLTLSNTSGTNTATGAITSTGGLTIPASTVFDMSTYVLTCSSTLTNNGTIKISSIANPPFTTTTTSIGGTVRFATSSGGQFIPGKTYTTLTLSNTTGTNTAIGAITSTGDLTIPTTSTTLDMSTYVLTCSGTLSNNGILKTSSTANPPFTTTTTSIGGTVQFTASSGGQYIPAKTYAIITLSNTSGTNTAIGAFTSSGELTIPASTKLDMSTFRLTMSSTLRNFGTLKTSSTANPPFSTGTTSIGGTVEFAAASGGQFIPGKTYSTLMLSNTSGTNTALGSIISLLALTIPASTTFDMSTFDFTCSRSLTNNGTLKLSSTSNPPYSTTNSTLAGTVEFAASGGGQFIPVKTYTNLSLSNTGGTSMSALGDITVSGNLTIASGSILVMGGNTLILSAAGTTLTNNGTISTTSTFPFTDSRTSLIFGGTINYNRSNGLRNIAIGNYTNLTLSNSSGIYTALGAITVSGTLTTTLGGTLAMGTNTLTLSGTATTLTNGGTITTSATTAFTDSRTTKTFGGTVNYGLATGGQTIASGSYSTLTLSNTSGTNTANGAITVANAFTIPASTTLDMSTFGITCSSTLTNSGTLKTSSTANPPFSTTSTSVGGTVQLAVSTGGQSIPSFTYNNLTLSNSSGNQTLNGDIKIQGTLTITSGGKLKLNGYSIRAVNAFSGTGQITGGSASRMNITGSSAGTFYMDQTTPLTTNRLKYLGLAVSATATLGNTVAIYGDSSYSGNVDLKTSSVLTSNTIGTNAALLQLKYNVASEYHAVLGMNGGSLLGEAMVEDYFYSGSRTYRQVGHALDSAMSLNQITDDFDLFGSISNGSSGRGSGKNKDGLYAATSTAKNSVFTYKEDVASGSKWVPFTTSTSNSTIATGMGIMFVMRPTGSGESGNYNAQIMDYEGAINQRRRAVSVLKNTGTGTYGYNLLANPYAAYLDFDKFIDTNSAILADVGFYKYNKSTKNYTTHSKSGSLWFKSSTAFTVNSANVDPGDAFWIRVKSAGTVYMNPKMTAYSKATDVSKENKLEIDTTAYSMLGIKMKSQADTTLGDEVSILSASWGGDMSYKQGDMANMNGTCIDLSVVSSDKESLAFKTLSITQSWLIPLNVQACAIGSYSFDFAIDANKPGYEAEYELLDKYLNKSMKIVSGSKLTFEVNADAASLGGDRFYINAIPSKVLNDNDLNTDRVVTIFPNPISSADVLNIHVAQGKGLQIELVNAMGQQLYRAEHVAGGRILEVDLMSLRVAPGIYYLKATRDNESETQSVIIN
jgi:hypothetical protein